MPIWRRAFVGTAHMRSLISLPLLALCLVACATLPATARTPFLPAGVYGTYLDNDVGAINQSAWAFASPANTRGNPIDAARAVIALEYLPGELTENPRWIKMRTGVDLHLGRARDQLRQILGIRPDAPPQLVVNTLLALNLDLQMGDEPAAMHVLALAGIHPAAAAHAAGPVEPALRAGGQSGDLAARKRDAFQQHGRRVTRIRATPSCRRRSADPTLSLLPWSSIKGVAAVLIRHVVPSAAALLSTRVCWVDIKRAQPSRSCVAGAMRPPPTTTAPARNCPAHPRSPSACRRRAAGRAPASCSTPGSSAASPATRTRRSPSPPGTSFPDRRAGPC